MSMKTWTVTIVNNILSRKYLRIGVGFDIIDAIGSHRGDP